MAASVYATPPPDHLSDDETALSDVSNSSQLSSPSNSMKTLKLDLLPDNSKKRRKQSTPIRISAEVAAAAAAKNAIDAAKIENNNCSNESLKKSNEMSPTLPRIYLSNISQLQQKHSPPLTAGVVDYTKNDSDDCASAGEQKENGKHDTKRHIEMLANANLLKKYVNNLNCDQCGLRLDSEIKLGLHILQEHGPKHFALGDRSAEDDIPKLFVKKEPLSSSSGNDWDHGDDADDKNKLPITANGGNNVASALKPDDWLSLSGLPFPFPPETAAMLSASGYLPQLPLLGVAGVSPFTGADNLTRSNAPPLRIFNPEAYCDLCNKEFCNKYFLKTHKANKHNIYEPAVSTAADIASTSQLNLNMSVFQMQQQAAAQQLVSPKSSPSQQQQQTPSNASQTASSGATPAQETPIFCDICFKRFANVFAMRRHRSKVHEIPPPSNSDTIAADGKNSASASASASASNTSTPLTVPDGFREDFTVEQEDTTFTPQPRKLSPQSIQQAREANFSVEKLKRLGVINPEAFCELCGKEYCNKYFLRTHKIKRHGIFMPADDANKDERTMPSAASVAAAATAWQLMQSAPLNLMIGTAEQMHHFQNQRKKLEAGEIRQMSIDSVDDDYEQTPKRRKTNDEKKKLSREMCEENDCDDDESNQKLSDDASHGGTNQQDGDAISVDLQKLQSMIMQLNDLNAQRPVPCAICGKEQENQFALHSHMITEHSSISGGIGSAGGDNNNGHKVSPSTSPGSVQQAAGADGYSEASAHHTPTYAIGSPIRDGFITPERPISGLSLPPVQAPQAVSGGGGGGGGMNDRRPYTITPTSSYCEICNKELCNKYFMKTHMQRMHGIEIENGAQIGGVVCNICNKELCSKYFLRVHKHNTHGIIEEGSPLPQPRQNGDNNAVSSQIVESVAADSMFPSMESSPVPVPVPSSSSTSSLKPGEVSELSNRYFTHFTEVCPLCSRRFRGSKWLRTHLLADHGKAGTDKLREIEHQLAQMPKSSTSPTLKIPNGAFSLNPNEANFLQQQKHSLTNLFAGDDATLSTSTTSTSKQKEYPCSYCSFSTPSYAFLFMHERSHSLLGSTPLANPSNGDDSHSESIGDAIKSEAISTHGKQHQQQQQQHVSVNVNVNHSSNERAASATPTSTPATTPVPKQVSRYCLINFVFFFQFSIFNFNYFQSVEFIQCE